MSAVIYPNPTSEVLAIGKLNFQGVGYIQIQDTWWERLKTPANKTDTNACVILAEIVFRYRPAIADDENGKVKIGKWFKGDLLQKSYKQLSEKFGLTIDQVKRAVERLENGGYIRRVLRDEDGYYNRMYIQIFPEAIEWLTFDNANLPAPSPQTCLYPIRKNADTVHANLHDIQRRLNKEDLTNNTNIHSSFVETSSTADNEPCNSFPLNAKKENIKGNPQPPFLTATATDDEPAEYVTADPKSTAKSYGKINAVETPENTQPIQTPTQTKKTPPAQNKAAKTTTKQSTTDMVLYTEEELDALTAEQAVETINEVHKEMMDSIKRIQSKEPLKKTDAPNKEAHSACVKWFCETFYLERYKTKYHFAPKDAKAVKELLKFFQFKKEDATQSQLVEMFKLFITKTTNDFVLKNGHSLTIIWGQQNQIFNELQSKKTNVQSTTQKIQIVTEADEFCKW